MNDSLNTRQEITEMLNACRQGKREALDALMEIVYEELRKLAHGYLLRERRNHTLQTNALVNEAYMRLIDQRTDWQNRSHFFGIAATLMREILVNHARDKMRLKRGGKNTPLSLDEASRIIVDKSDEDILALNEALKKLSKFDVRMVQVVELHHFMGLTIEETAKFLNISPATVKREWNAAKSWLHREIKG